MKLKAVVFDLDGVLLDTEYHQWQGWNHAFEALGVDVALTKTDYLKYAGKRGDVIEAELYSDYGLDLNKGVLVDTKEDHLIRWFSKERLEPMSYVKDAISFVENHPELKIGLASGGPREEVILKLKRSKLDQHFPNLITGSDVTKGKPNPEIYLQICEILDVNPTNALSIEDTQYGLWSAKDAGMYCVAVPTEYSANHDFTRADKQFDNLKRVIEWLDSSLQK